jgi:hypothetical protein
MRLAAHAQHPANNFSSRTQHLQKSAQHQCFVGFERAIFELSLAVFQLTS